MVVIQIIEGSATVQENFAYVSLPMDQMVRGTDGTHSKVFQNVPVIGHNTQLGTFDCILTYDVTGLPKPLINEEQGQNSPKEGDCLTPLVRNQLLLSEQP